MRHGNAAETLSYRSVTTAVAVWRKAGKVCLRHIGFGLGAAPATMCRAKAAGHGLRGRIELEK